MAYSDFTLKDAVQKFGLALSEHPDLFAATAEVEPGECLKNALKEYQPLATAINTEKARSELLIAPVLVEVRRLLGHRVSLFSGIDFNVDASQGLTGFCDFLLSRSSEQQFLTAPLVAVVEAKNENLKSGLGQCVSSLVAAGVFNAREGSNIARVHGVVTTGTLWRFLTLEGTALTLDQREYHIDRLTKVLGILSHLLTAV